MTLHVETNTILRKIAAENTMYSFKMLRWRGWGKQKWDNFHYWTRAFTQRNENTTTIKLQIYWGIEGGVTPCIDVRVYQTFKHTCCSRFQDRPWWRPIQQKRNRYLRTIYKSKCVKNEASGARGMRWVIGEFLTGFRWGNLKVKRKLEDLAVDLGIILKWILRK